MADFDLWRRIQGKYRRTTGRVLFRRPFVIQAEAPIVSFTFDDFPRSALQVGGKILKKHGGTGTYFTSFGLMGKEEPTGAMFVREDLPLLLRDGHEIGCHTFGHCDAGETGASRFEESIVENRKALNEFCPGIPFRSLSYPISHPRPGNKRAAGRHFACCRGGGQTLNAGVADLNCLASHFLEQSRENPAEARNLIDETCRLRGWLIFSTHDISERPTRYGCTPEFFEGVVGYAAKSGAQLLTMAQALEELKRPARGETRGHV